MFLQRHIYFLRSMFPKFYNYFLNSMFPVLYFLSSVFPQNDSCIMTGSDESHLKVSLIVTDKVGQCAQTTIFEEKGEPKRIRTEVLMLTSLTPYR